MQQYKQMPKRSTGKGKKALGALGTPSVRGSLSGDTPSQSGQLILRSTVIRVTPEPEVPLELPTPHATPAKKVKEVADHMGGLEIVEEDEDKEEEIEGV